MSIIQLWTGRDVDLVVMFDERVAQVIPTFQGFLRVQSFAKLCVPSSTAHHPPTSQDCYQDPLGNTASAFRQCNYRQDR